MKTFSVFLVFCVSLCPVVSGAGLDPTRIEAPLQAWFKADSIQNVAEGGPVGTWADSWNGHHDATALPTREPLFNSSRLNGRPALTFNRDPLDRHLDFILPLNPLSNSFSAVLVLRADVYGDAQGILSVMTTAADAWYPAFYIEDQAGVSVHTVGEYLNAFAVGHPYERGSWIIETLTFDLTNMVLRTYQNGAQEAVTQWAGAGLVSGNTGTNAAIPMSPVWRIGSGQYPIFGTIGEIAEVMVFANVLTPGDRDAVETYLSEKYGIARTPSAIVLQDYFNGPNSNDINAGVTQRQLGSDAGVTFTKSSSTGASKIATLEGAALRVWNNQTSTAKGISTVSPDLDFKPMEETNTFSLRVNLNPNRGSLGEVAGAGIVFRSDHKNAGLSDGKGVSLFIQQSGAYALVIDGDPRIPAGSVLASLNYAVDADVINDRLTIRVNGIALQDSAGASEFLLSPADSNYITFYSSADPGTGTAYSTFDNFDFLTPPPPPIPPDVQLTVVPLGSDKVQIRWPVTGNYQLQTADAPEGPWFSGTLTWNDDGTGINVAEDLVTPGAARFYRAIFPYSN